MKLKALVILTIIAVLGAGPASADSIGPGSSRDEASTSATDLESNSQSSSLNQSVANPTGIVNQSIESPRYVSFGHSGNFPTPGVAYQGGNCASPSLYGNSGAIFNDGRFGNDFQVEGGVRVPLGQKRCHERLERQAKINDEAHLAKKVSSCVDLMKGGYTADYCKDLGIEATSVELLTPNNKNDHQSQ